ncbi:MAG TPA: glycosyltransferase [Verrucomicrobiae bacterium]|nr:glycosyltransferase [Verrucomicrobiae bacterium]
MGGTEVYVDGLARDLLEMGVETVVAAPATVSGSHSLNGLRVRRFAVCGGSVDLRQLYGEGDPHAAAEFEEILDDEKADLLHLHAFTQGASIRLLRAAKKRRLPVVFTYHTPTVSCQRGTLLRWGKEFCDGKMSVRECAGCTLHGLGLNQPAAWLAGALPPAVGRSLGNAGLHGGIWTALRMSELVALRQATFRSLSAEADRIVAVCRWVRDLLLLNDIPAEKITLCRHGIRLAEGARTKPAAPLRDPRGPLRVAFFGRLDPTKGVHVLIQAWRAAPSMNAQLDIYGVVQSAANKQYSQRVRLLANEDPRINFCEPLPTGQVVIRLRDYDVLAVPSQWLETGPLVALEAFAAGTPVIGWNIGGIAEIVQHQVNGLLIEPDAPRSWVDVLQALAADRTLLAKLKAGVRPPRTSAQIAREMLDLYASLLKSNASSTKSALSAFSTHTG